MKTLFEMATSMVFAEPIPFNDEKLLMKLKEKGWLNSVPLVLSTEGEALKVYWYAPRTKRPLPASPLKPLKSKPFRSPLGNPSTNSDSGNEPNSIQQKLKLTKTIADLTEKKRKLMLLKSHLKKVMDAVLIF